MFSCTDHFSVSSTSQPIPFLEVQTLFGTTSKVVPTGLKSPLKLKEKLYPGDVLHTGPKSKITLSLGPQKIRLVLYSHSSLTLNAFYVHKTLFSKDPPPLKKTQSLSSSRSYRVALHAPRHTFLINAKNLSVFTWGSFVGLRCHNAKILCRSQRSQAQLSAIARKRTYNDVLLLTRKQRTILLNEADLDYLQLSKTTLRPSLLSKKKVETLKGYLLRRFKEHRS